MKVRQVAGGLIFNSDDALLLVRNDRPYSKTSDWSTPGGVIDKGETVLEGLTREVIEETNIRVNKWQGPIYCVCVNFPDRGFFLEVQTFIAEAWEGELKVDDPDGIVTDAMFCLPEKQVELLSLSPDWVKEPLLEWQKALEENSGNQEIVNFEYEVSGYGLDDFKIKRRL